MTLIEKIIAWETQSPADRRAIVATVATALGNGFLPEPDLLGRAGLGAVRHQDTNIVFLLIPGGEFDMGLSNAEEAELITRISGSASPDERQRVESELSVHLAALRPVHRVHVRPFLCAREHLSSALVLEKLTLSYADDLADFGDAATLRAADAPAAARTFGFRLLSDAEWEYVAREGGATSWCVRPEALQAFDVSEKSENDFGIRHLASAAGEWVADQWHETYDGAPAVSVTWDASETAGVHRGAHTSLQDPIEAMTAHAAFRERANPNTPFQLGGIRLAIDLPAVTSDLGPSSTGN